MAVEGARDLFEARLEDAMRKCSSGSVAQIPFLTYTKLLKFVKFQ